MADRAATSLRAARKSLTDVVAPAVDLSDPLATEQLSLVADYLEFLRSRVDHIYERERFELAHHLAMARFVHDAAAGFSDLVAPLSAAISDAEHAGGSVAEMRAATANLTAAIRLAIRGAAALPEHVRSAIERHIVEASGERIMLDRAWFLPYGFEPRPDEVSPLESIFTTRPEPEALA